VKGIGLFALMGLFLAMGCAGGISRQAKGQVTYTGAFSQIQREPGRHVNAVLLLGGKIIDYQAKEGLSELLVLHLPLDWQGRPKDGDQSEGRYLVRSKAFLDPAIYKKDALLSQVGRVNGSETLAIGGFEYLYPVIEPIEIKVWPKQQESPPPSFQFGIGIGVWK
jgi:outer membrane lipoprotein